MINIKYAFIQLRKRIVATILIIVQISASIVLLNTSFSVKNDIDSTLHKINNIFEDQSNILTLKGVINDLFKINNSSYEKLDKYLSDNSSFKLIHINEQNFFIKPFNGVNNFIETTKKFQENGTSYYITRGLYLSYDALKYFNIKVKEGRNLSEEDFKINNGQDMPVLLGSKYSDYFKIGDRIETVSINDNSKIYVKVVGFLEDNSYGISHDDPSRIIILDNYVVLPYQQFDIYGSNLNDYDKQSLLYNDIFSSVIAINDKDNNKINLIKEQIIKEGKENGIPINIDSVKNKIDDYKNNADQARQFAASLFAIIFIFSSVGFVSSILYSLKKRIKELGIHLMLGATIKDIALRVMYEIFIIMFLSYAAALIFICCNQWKSLTFINLIETTLSIVILSILLSIVPVIKVCRMSIDQLIRGNE